ncbi:glycosyltransferase family 2 protein [Granulicella tundricola]|uniref:Glycosyl transferase family 2 n=1 Tax=Granulicella tundricola (strain ATCC BAA-1859 / DSM 23138 / MP5ACTX9) TaxID=1198114 RepID=E8WV67_GRATM|nr:glycosyltransferase family A protein [Granulicella tundricola]ADW67242.1 glycosyl transferase family 2 [Granulicella tundricola MP5ACTX9]
MRLSFVIPAYNEEAWLQACVESIQKQTQALNLDAEIIVVNNASTDGTRALALSIPGVILVDEPRKGLTHARQAGFNRSTGALIANVDSDSRLTEGWVQQVLSTFASTPGLVALSGPVVYYDLTMLERQFVRIFYLQAWLVYALNRWILRVGSMVQGGNFVIARPALEAIGGFNLAISFYGEDTDIARRLNEIGMVRFTFDLKMFSSARRLRKEGMLTTAARYTVNYFWTTFLERPFTNTHADIRD